MSSPAQDDDLDTHAMYAPPWVRDSRSDTRSDSRRDAQSDTRRDAQGDAKTDDAASAAFVMAQRLRRSLPAAPQLGQTQPDAKPHEPDVKSRPPEQKLRGPDKVPFDGDVAHRRLREHGSLDPVQLPSPPARSSSVSFAVVARLGGAFAIASVAALFVAGVVPMPSVAILASADGEANASPLTRLFGARKELAQPTPPQDLQSAQPMPAVARAPEERAQPAVEPVAQSFAALGDTTRTPAIALPAAAPAAAMPPAAPEPKPAFTLQSAPPTRVLDRDEIAMLIKRGEDLIAQGDIASARLTLTRAAEAGEARAAFALGATYDPTVLKKLGVRGVAPDVSQARAWYGKAAELGSAEAARRLDQLVQSR